MSQNVQAKVADFFATARQKNFAKGQMIAMAGEDPAGVMLLESGVVEQYDITPAGNRVTVNIFKPPAFFPMSWAINGTPNEYFFEALSDVVVRQAAADRTVAFIKDNPDVLFDLLARVYKGTDGLLKRLVLAASGMAANRLIFELLIEAYRFGSDVDEVTKQIKISRNSLAARSGLARETVSRELHKLQDEGLLTLSERSMVLSIEALEKKLLVTV